MSGNFRGFFKKYNKTNINMQYNFWKLSGKFLGLKSFDKFQNYNFVIEFAFFFITHIINTVFVFKVLANQKKDIKI